MSEVDEYGIISDEVPVAQWIERVPPEHETAGSSPVGDVLIPKVLGMSPAVSVKSHSPLPYAILFPLFSLCFKKSSILNAVGARRSGKYLIDPLLCVFPLQRQRQSPVHSQACK